MAGVLRRTAEVRILGGQRSSCIWICVAPSLLLHLLEGGAEQGDRGRLDQVHAWLPLLPHSLLGGVVWRGYCVAVETLA